MAKKPRQLSAPKGSLPVLQYCTPDQLSIDPAYQRELDARSYLLIDRIAAAWDWGLCQPLVVAQRLDRGLFVVDGQHRLQAAKRRGDIPQLPCVIFQPADAADEAATFVALNQERRELTPYALWKAALCSGDEAAAALAAILQGVGLSFAGAADARTLKPGQVNIVNSVRNFHSKHGDARTRVVLVSIATGFHGQVLAYAGTLFRAIGNVLLDRGSIDAALMHGILSQQSQEEWVGEFRQRAAERNIGTQAAANDVIATAYAEAADDVIATAYAEAADDEPDADPAPATETTPTTRGPGDPGTRGPGDPGTRGPAKLDLGSIPSSMEQRASAWRGRDTVAG